MQAPGAGQAIAQRDAICPVAALSPGSGALAAVQVPPESVSMNGSICPLSSRYWPIVTHVPTPGHATPASMVLAPAVETLSGAASPGSGTLAAVQVPSASASTYTSWTPPWVLYQPVATQVPVAGHMTSVRVADSVVTASSGSGGLTGSQWPPDSLSITGVRTPGAESKNPTAAQVPGAGQETPLSVAKPLLVSLDTSGTEVGV